MSGATTAATTAFALLAFAANSLLCRFALAREGEDPASFTLLRLGSGALVLALLVTMRRRPAATDPPPEALTARPSAGQRGGAALLAYAAGFSFAYVQLDAASGALLLFATVQTTMLVAGLRAGERFAATQWLGFALAVCGVLALLLPGAGAPGLLAALPMIAAGVAWGLYSLWGRGARDPARDTARNFLWATVLALPLLLIAETPSPPGALAAIASGAIASALGYVAWYAVLPALGALRAAALQLAVPALTAAAAVLLLEETFGLRLLWASLGILGGLTLVVFRRR